MRLYEIDIERANARISNLQAACTLLANRLEDAVKGRVKVITELETLKTRLQAGDWEDD